MMSLLRKKNGDEIDVTEAEVTKTEAVDAGRRTHAQKAQGKIGLFVRMHWACILCAFLMLVALIVGGGMRSAADNIIAQKESQLMSIQNRTESMKQSLKQTITVVDEPDHGFDTQRQYSDYEYFKKWIRPAFEWKGLTEYLNHREVYVADLGPEHAFVRAGGLMQPLESQPLGQLNYGGFYNPNENMSCKIVDGPVQYVSAIDEETGVYSYVAVVYVTGKDNMENAYKSSVPIIMTYDILPDDGTGQFRIARFTAST